MTVDARRLTPFDPVLSRLRDDAVTAFGGRVSLEPRRVCVGPFSQVLEVRVHGDARALTAFIKVLTPRATTVQELEATRRNISREYSALQRACETLAGRDGFSVARPLACYPDLCALVTERVEGIPLAAALSKLRGSPSPRTIEDTARVLRNVGAWLSAFQGSPDTTRPPVSLDRMRNYLDTRLKALTELRVFAPDLRDALLRHFDRRASAIAARDLGAVPVHADFTPENVLVDGERVSVIDFTMAKDGARYLDVSHMFMHVDMLKMRPWFRPGAIDRQTAALLDGFEPNLRIERPLLELLLVQHVVCFVLQTAQMKIARLPAFVLAWHIRRQQVKWLRDRVSA